MQKIDTKANRTWFSGANLAVTIIAATHLAITLPLAYLLNIWVDEASTLHTTEAGIFSTFGAALTNEKQAPLYFWLLSFWREIDHSVFFARSLSGLFSVLAIVVVFRLVRNLSGVKDALLAAALFGLHPFLVWATLEIRGYSLVILISAILLKLFVDGYLLETDLVGSRGPNRARLGFSMVAAVGLYSNYYLGFILAAGFVALLVLRRWHELKIYFASLIPVAIVFGPMFFWIKAQLEVNTGGFQNARSLSEGVRAIWGHVLTFVLPTEVFPDGGTSNWSVARLWIVRLGILATVALLIRHRSRLKNTSILVCFFVISGVVAAFLLLGYLALGRGYIEIRHASVLFVPIIVLVVLTLREVLSHQLLLPVAAIFGCFLAYGVASLYPDLAKRGDWARVAQYIQQNEGPNEAIVVFEVYDALALPYYYKGSNQIVPNTRFFEWDYEGPPSTEDAFREQIAFVETEIPDAHQIWVATEDRCQDAQTHLSCQPFEDFLASHYDMVSQKDFYRERVRLFRKKRSIA